MIYLAFFSRKYKKVRKKRNKTPQPARGRHTYIYLEVFFSRNYKKFIKIGTKLPSQPGDGTRIFILKFFSRIYKRFRKKRNKTPQPARGRHMYIYLEFFFTGIIKSLEKKEQNSPASQETAHVIISWRNIFPGIINSLGKKEQNSPASQGKAHGNLNKYTMYTDDATNRCDTSLRQMTPLRVLVWEQLAARYRELILTIFERSLRRSSLAVTRGEFLTETCRRDNSKRFVRSCLSL